MFSSMVYQNQGQKSRQNVSYIVHFVPYVKIIVDLVIKNIFKKNKQKRLTNKCSYVIIQAREFACKGFRAQYFNGNGDLTKAKRGNDSCRQNLILSRFYVIIYPLLFKTFDKIKEYRNEQDHLLLTSYHKQKLDEYLSEDLENSLETPDKYFCLQQKIIIELITNIYGESMGLE